MAHSIEQLREIVDLAKRKRWDELEERWLELAEAPPAEMRFYDSMARALLKNGQRERLGEFFSLMAGALVEAGRPAEAVEIVRSAWRHAPDLAVLREQAVEALRSLYGKRVNFERFIAAAGLEGRADLLGALGRFEEMLHCDEGEVFEHKTFGIGVVEEIEPEQGRVTIRFAGKGLKEFTFEGVRDYLTRLDRDGFRAERARAPEALRQRAFEAGAEFVRFVLRDFPEGLSQLDLRDLLLDGVMSREQWDRWWAANRKAIRRDPYIDWEGGARDPMRLRAEPKTYYETVLEEFRESESASKRLALVAEIAKHRDEETPPEDFGHRLLEILVQEFEALDERDSSGRLERIFLGREVADLFSAVELPAQFDEAKILEASDDCGRLILGLSSPELQRRAVEVLSELDSRRAVEVAVAILPDAQPRFAQWLIEWLVARGEVAAASGAVDQMLRSPRRNPETFLWVARQFAADKFAALSLEVEARGVVQEAVEFIKDLQNRVERGEPNASALRGLQAKLKNLLAEDHYALVRLAVAPLDAEQARAFCKLFESHAAFPDHYLAPLIAAVYRSRPDLEEARKVAAGDQLDESILYVTRESLEQRRRELQHLRTVEIPKNSREIGEAAALGDLSENAEYEAARHRQRILFERAEQLQRDIERARLIDPSRVPTDRVWIGTRFDARNVETGEVVTYTILGAWDSRPEQNVLSYLTPAARQFLRRRVGERVVVERSDAKLVEYEILRIENALA